MASKHGPPPPPSDEGPASKRVRLEATSETLAFRVQLNPADCDLDFDIDGNGLQGRALHEEGFAYCWSGARASMGITGGKYCFGCKIVSEQAIDMSDTPLDQQHLCRLGTSRGDDLVGNLGESLQSFGYGGTGKFSTAGKFSDYGSRFGVGDTIICAVDLDAKPLATIGFSVNGTWLGVARNFNASSMSVGIVSMSKQNLTWDSALFPHILLKNVVVQLQFSIEDGLIPEKGYKPWNLALGDGNAIIGPSFVSPNESEVLMMVGLPASGKTTWAEKWVKEHPKKRYILLGTNLALDQMKVPGLHRRNNYGERFDRLMDCATKIFNTLLDRASKTMRNYILDQTNVYKGARIRKLRAFRNHRKIAMVIFPPSSELKIRAEKRVKEMGKEVPAEAVNEMIANFVLPITKNMPCSNELFDEVWFEELNRAEAQRHLDEMKCALGSSDLIANRTDGRHQSNIQPEVLHRGPDYFISQEVNTRNYGPSSFGVPQTRLENATLSFPNDGPYENYHKFGTDTIPKSEVGPCGSWSNHNKNAYVSELPPPNVLLPYRTYNSVDTLLSNDVHRTCISTYARRPMDILHYRTYSGVNPPDEPSFGNHYYGERSIYEPLPMPPPYDRNSQTQVYHSRYPPLHHPRPNSRHNPVQDTYSSPPYAAPPARTRYRDPHQMNPGPHRRYPHS